MGRAFTVPVALGAVTGLATGASAGVGSAALLSLAIPGVGPVIASTVIGAAVLGAVGAAVGHAFEKTLTLGMPRDEVFVYEDALRRGRSVLVALVRDDELVPAAREALAASGTLSIDQAQEEWWIGLRDIEAGARMPRRRRMRIVGASRPRSLRTRAGAATTRTSTSFALGTPTFIAAPRFAAATSAGRRISAGSSTSGVT